MPPSLPGGKRVIGGPLVAEKAASSVGNSDTGEIPTSIGKVLLKLCYQARRVIGITSTPEKKMRASGPRAGGRKFFYVDSVKRYACRQWK